MRVPQRNFIVEFKSRSRQSKATKPASIWGDTDLRAAARQVEEESADFYAERTTEPVIETETVIESGNQLTPVEQTVGAMAAEVDDVGQTSGQISEAAEAPSELRFESQDSEPIEPALTKSDTPMAGSVDPADPQDRALLARRKTNKGSKVAAVNMASAFLTRSEFLELDAENQRLKAELRAKLVEHNQTLKRMLGRFS